MAFVMKEQVLSKDLKSGDHITTDSMNIVYKVHLVGERVEVSKVSNLPHNPVIGFPLSVFDSETWYRCEDSKKETLEVVIERKSIVSSNLVSCGYNEKSLTLEVEFSGGGVYQYTSVPKAIYESFMESESKGKFFAFSIKGKFPYKKVK